MSHHIDLLQAALEGAKKEHEELVLLRQKVKQLEELLESRRLEVRGMEVICYDFLNHLRTIFRTSDTKFHLEVNKLMQAHGIDLDFDLP